MKTARVAPRALSDLTGRLEHKRRCRDLRELAAEEGIPLPMPAAWIATLEALGYVVDLVTGEWSAPGQYGLGPALIAAAGDTAEAGGESVP